MPERGKILIIRGGAIGDFILTLPAIAAIRRQFPDAFLEVLGYPHIAQLAVAGGVVNRVQSIEARALAGFFARRGMLAEDLSNYFSEFDIIVSYLYDPDGIFQTNVGLCTTAQFIAGPHRPDEAAKIHATQVYLKPLERLAIFGADPVPRLALPAPTGKRLQIALHPGSGSEQKNWPEEKWMSLLGHMVEVSSHNLLLIGGEAEGGRLQRLAAALPSSRVQVAQSLPLADLASLLAGSVAYVGHDSGISHLAAAVGLPGVVLWGHTAEEIWRPPSERIMVIREPGGLRQIEVGQVMASLKAAVPNWSIEG